MPSIIQRTSRSTHHPRGFRPMHRGARLCTRDGRRELVMRTIARWSGRIREGDGRCGSR